MLLFLLRFMISKWTIFWNDILLAQIGTRYEVGNFITGRFLFDINGNLWLCKMGRVGIQCTCHLSFTITDLQNGNRMETGSDKTKMLWEEKGSEILDCHVEWMFESKKTRSNALSFCPDKMFFVQDNFERLQFLLSKVI